MGLADNLLRSENHDRCGKQDRYSVIPIGKTHTLIGLTFFNHFLRLLFIPPPHFLFLSVADSLPWLHFRKGLYWDAKKVNDDK